LCGALGKPTREEERPRNVTWAIRLLGRFDVPADPEWARLHERVFAEARSLGLPLGVEDQLRLCQMLVAVNATTASAAAAYDPLPATFPEAVRSEHAWLYCRAALEHGVSSPRDLIFFNRTFREEEAARAFFAARNWDFDGLEYAYLERAAAQRPGQFPEELGPAYPARGAERLLERSRLLERAGQPDAARAAALVLLKLAPASAAAHDRLACLHYRAGNLDQATALLEAWQRLEPANYWPLVRQAVMRQQGGDPAGSRAALRQALRLTDGALRGSLAFLGARLALQTAL